MYRFTRGKCNVLNISNTSVFVLTITDFMSPNTDKEITQSNQIGIK